LLEGPPPAGRDHSPATKNDRHLVHPFFLGVSRVPCNGGSAPMTEVERSVSSSTTASTLTAATSKRSAKRVPEVVV
jgi:hypothetical protein